MNLPSRLSFAVLLLAGCDVFDPALYMNADGGTTDTGARDAIVDSSRSDTALVDATSDGGFALSDRCSASAPELPSLSANVIVDTTGLDDLISDIASCTGSAAPGREGFFSVRMSAGDRWHFHVTALEAAGDPIVYVLGAGCDPRTCQRGDATNNCNLRDEHFTYVAPSTGTFLVGVDDANDRGGTYEVLPIQPVCGNGVTDHSETCDDDADPTCTSECLRRLSSGESEDEPNDDPAGANILDFTAGMIQGDVASQCDLASFRFTAPAGATLSATVLPRGSATCDAAAPALDLELVSTDGRTLYGSVSAGPGECPAIDGSESFASGLTAGDYVLRVVPTGVEASLFPFDLTLDVAAP